MAQDSNIENSQSTTTDELLQLKKDTLWKIIDEKKNDDPSLVVSKQAVVNYLLDEWSDELNVGNIVKSLLWKVFCKSRDNLVEISKDIKECNTKSELDSLEASILNWTSVSSQTSTTTENTPASTPESAPQSTTTVPEHSDDSEHIELDHFNINVASKYREFYNKLKWKEKPDFLAFSCAKYWYDKLLERWELSNTKYLTVVDFTKPRSKKRFYVINMVTMTVEVATRVWHWHNSWKWEWAKSFSNTNGSEQSSLWFLTTATHREDNYKHTRSWLRMFWTEKDKKNNWNAAWRWIFMHKGAENPDKKGDLFSQWCFVIPNNISETVLNKVGWWSLLFAFAKSKDYFEKSDYFEKLPNWDINIS